MTEDKMVVWHHWLNGYEFEQAPRDGGGQGSLACCSPWGLKESDTTEQLDSYQLSNKLIISSYYFSVVVYMYQSQSPNLFYPTYMESQSIQFIHSVMSDSM